MPIEHRIREGLAANVADVAAPIEANLESVQQRHRSRVRVKVGAAVATTAVLAAAPWAAVTVLDDRDGVEPAGPASTTLAGTYEVDVDGGRGTRGMTGTWVVTLSDDAGIRLDPPSGYDGPPPGDGETYVVTDGALTTNSFIMWPGCQQSDPPVGRYRFETSATGVAFELVEDTCPARIQLFGTRWERLP